MHCGKVVIRLQVQWSAKFAQSWLVFTSAVPLAVVAGVVRSPTLLGPRMLSSPLAGTRTCSQDQALLSMLAPVNRVPCQTFSSVKMYIIILNYNCTR